MEPSSIKAPLSLPAKGDHHGCWLTSGDRVLVHGGFVDGSGWQGVYSVLRKDGDSVSIVQNPAVSLEDDVAATKRVIDAQSEPVIFGGHSYGGAVITEAGNDPQGGARPT